VFTFSASSRLAQPGLQGPPMLPRNYDMTRDGRRFLGVLVSGTPQAESSNSQIEVVLNWTEELKRLVPTK
jgi:hypothetical protein